MPFPGRGAAEALSDSQTCRPPACIRADRRVGPVRSRRGAIHRAGLSRGAARVGHRLRHAVRVRGPARRARDCAHRGPVPRPRSR
ncbi:MAG: hypothetical protein ThorAB25_21230, partial [Candidatus Thorarchaeota archaeon AB_25]